MACDKNIDVFQSITGADAETAGHCLEAFEGDLDRAVSHFLDAGVSPMPRRTVERSGAARANGSVVETEAQDDSSAGMNDSRAAQRSAACKAKDAEQRRNQGHLEEEAALQQALAASNMASGNGNGAALAASAPGSSREAAPSEQSRNVSIGSSDSEQVEEYEPEVDSDVEMDTEEEYLQKLAATQHARSRLAQEAQRAAAGGSGPSYGGGRDADLPDLPAGIDVEEARMVEAAILGIPYTGRLPDYTNGGMGGAGSYRDNDFASVSPAVQEQRSVIQEQDWAYKESLQADQERAEAKEAKAAAEEAAARAESEATAAEEERQQQAEHAHAKQLVAKTEALLPEPPVGSDVVTVAVKLPDGQRLTYRFLKSSPLEAIYNFVDVKGPSAAGPRADSQPGTYFLVTSRPRKVHEPSAETSLADAGFERQEMLMLEPRPE